MSQVRPPTCVRLPAGGRIRSRRSRRERIARRGAVQGRGRQSAEPKVAHRYATNERGRRRPGSPTPQNATMPRIISAHPPPPMWSPYQYIIGGPPFPVGHRTTARYDEDPSIPQFWSDRTAGGSDVGPQPSKRRDTRAAAEDTRSSSVLSGRTPPSSAPPRSAGRASAGDPGGRARIERVPRQLAPGRRARLESAAGVALTRAYPLDVLGAQTQGMIEYWLVQGSCATRACAGPQWSCAAESTLRPPPGADRWPG